LADLTWPEVAMVAGQTLLAVPLGATEQHGPHLPIGTDTTVAVALADRLAASRGDVLVAPAVAYGSSGEHAGFPGTLSIGGPATATVVVELVRSADAFRGVVLVCGHGGNAEAVAAAAATLVAEGRDVLAWSPSIPGGDAHAGRTETSLLLALGAAGTRLAAAAPGNPRSLGELLAPLRSGGVAAVSPNGVLGDPTGATSEEGAHLLTALTAQLAGAVDERWARS
jgi:mycofactocin system creatininase family protein